MPQMDKFFMFRKPEEVNWKYLAWNSCQIFLAIQLQVMCSSKRWSRWSLFVSSWLQPSTKSVRIIETLSCEQSIKAISVFRSQSCESQLYKIRKVLKASHGVFLKTSSWPTLIGICTFAAEKISLYVLQKGYDFLSNTSRHHRLFQALKYNRRNERRDSTAWYTFASERLPPNRFRKLKSW